MDSVVEVLPSLLQFLPILLPRHSIHPWRSFCSAKSRLEGLPVGPLDLVAGTGSFREATHLMLDRNIGHNWLDHPLAVQAIELVKRHGGEQPDIEEALRVFMQLKLSQSCGYDEPSRSMSDRFPANVPKGAVLRSLETGWDGYQANSKQDVIDYTLHQTIAAFPTRPN